MKKQFNKQLLSLFLVICLLFGLAAPAAAVPNSKVSFTKVDNSAVSSGLLTKVEDELHGASEYLPTDMVRVSIFLEEASTIMAGYSTENIADNAKAMAYRADLKAQQEKITAAIESKLGEKLDVVWNLTLAANLISANIKYGQISKIEQVAGVDKVLLETRYEPDVAKTEEVNDPNMATSSAQIGSTAAWAAGYTGAGSRIAVIDTGTDTDHNSMNADAFQYSLAHAAGLAGVSVDEYLEKLDLLDAAEIDAVAAELNAPVTGAEAYINSKLPFGYNYIDGDFDVTHDNDSQGEHGSHVAGIATANAWLYMGEDNFVNAMSSVMVKGVAPDAQLITMKVFGKAGGAYDSDYMAAIEDAMVLGCDSANLSLGSANPGTSKNAEAEYQAILDALAESGMVVAMSAGNSGYWAEAASNAGYLYNTDVSMHTSGSPGSFTNSLGVASVDNDGLTGYFIEVDGMMIVYNEMLAGSTGSYTNAPFISIAGDYEYVFIDAIGTAEDWAVAGDALAGKIALCWRGETSFYEKAQLAVEAGAIATFICNNQPGVINMDLSDYPYTEPCASLSQTDGQAIMAASTPVTDADGNVLYYTGSMTVGASKAAGQFNTGYYTMSSFSSWGVPGSLELKPEITAPGGSIYSLYGSTPTGGGSDQYEVMSGTSMASPQVAGMAAVVAQYIRENNLVEKTGMSARQLAQSLLMSTAVPLTDASGAYYSVMQQGAGLGNVGAAVSADSYITMADGSNAGAADGKVKVELGDDPDKNGAYSATFTIHNMSDVEKNFELGADFFIQAPTMDNQGNLYMYTSTAMIGADVTWTVNGVAMAPASGLNGMDFNGDGVVNSDDGQALLNYATGTIETLSNMDKADLDADGNVDSHDAYLFLSNLTAGTATVAAGASATVTVNVSLSKDWKDTLDYYYPNGTYVQGYLFAESLADAEGNMGTSHSIPVLGFFGNWTDPSMYDVGSYHEFNSGDETRPPYLGNVQSNVWAVTYANEPDAMYFLGGNPLVPDETYMEERNAINSNDAIAALQYSAIRNASASKLMVMNETTGEVLAEAVGDAVDGAYYYTNGGVWYSTRYVQDVNVTPNTASEGDKINASWTLAPEYYVDAEGNVDWDALGEGATLDISLTIDNTAPELYDVSMSLTGKTMTVTASDNEYVAAVALYNKNGSTILAYTGAKQDIAKGETAEYTFDISEVNGKKFLLQVMDYAMNTTTYMVELQFGEEQGLPEMLAFDLSSGWWTGFDKTTTYEELSEYASSEHFFFAATLIEDTVLAADEFGDLYAMPLSDLTDTTFICNAGTILTDMALNKADGLVYAVDANGNLVTVDKLTGAVEVIGAIGVLTNTLACDANGTFYCNEFGTGNIYSFTLDTMDEPVYLANVVDPDGYEIESAYVQSMEVDPNTGMLCWTSYYSFYGLFGFAYYVEIDTATGDYTVYEDLWNELSCLIIPEKTNSDSWSAPTENVSEVKLSADKLNLLKGNRAQLSAAVLPWTAVDRTVTWTTTDDTVVTVDENGLVTALAAGSAVITATSNLDPSMSASCTVNVEVLGVTVTGTLQDEDGNPMIYKWNMGDSDTWEKVVDLDTSMISATDNGEGTLYVMDGVANVNNLQMIDMATGETLKTYANTMGAPMADMAYSEFFSTEDTDLLHLLYYYWYFPAKNPAELTTSGFDFSSYLAQYSNGSEYVGMTTGGMTTYNDKGVIRDAELVYLLDDAGTLWQLSVFSRTEDTFSAGISLFQTDLLDAGYAMTYDDNWNPLSSLIVGNDGNFYFSGWNGDTNVLYRLVYNSASGILESTIIGDVGDGVWPATLLQVSDNGSVEGNALESAEVFVVDTETVSAQDLRNAKSARMNGTAAAMTAESKSAKIEKLAEREAHNPNSDAAVTDAEKFVTVNVTAEELANNGVATVTWDTDALGLKSMIVNGDYTAKTEADGSVTFGYVSLNGIAAGDAIATLVFEAKKTNDTTVTIEQKQLNNASGATETVKVEFAHENTEVKNAVAPTCTTEGYTGDTYCTDCGALIAKGEAIPATGHSFGEWAVVSEATCTTEGVMARTCADCGHTETKATSVTGHSFGEWEVISEATCTTDGVKARTCAGCGCTETETIPATGHSFGEWEVVSEATCTTDGVKARTCAACGCTETETIAATGHSFGEWVVVNEVTCTTDGVMVRTCENCGHTETEIIPSECNAENFVDVPVDAWFHEAVDYVVGRGLMNGMSGTIFNPNGTMDRAMMVTVLHRLAGSPAFGMPTPFMDVPADAYYKQALEWAYAFGIINGVSETAFDPAGTVTREQMATILARGAKLLGMDTTVTGDLSAFADAADVSDWAVDGMTWAVQIGLIQGMPGNLLMPANATNRAEIATVMMRLGA